MSLVSSLGFALALWFVPNGAHAGAQRLGVILNQQAVRDRDDPVAGAVEHPCPSSPSPRRG